jgi:PAS domain S-box-containing protein
MKQSGHPIDDAAELRRKAEELAGDQAAILPKDFETLSPEKIRTMFHELHVHQIELEMQNEELRRSQAELSIAQARYFDFYDIAPVGYLTISEESIILDANLTIATMLGEHRRTLAGNPITRFIVREDQDIYYFLHQKLFKTHEPQGCELRMVHKDGAPFRASLNAIAVHEAGGNVLCRLVVSDVTRLFQALEAQQESAIQMSLAEQSDAVTKTDLLNEVNHRVKNNLMMILGLILAEKRRANAEGHHESDALLEKFWGRINGLLDVHQMLSDSKWQPISISLLAERICANVIASGGNPGQAIGLDVGHSNIEISPRQAGSIAIVFNELITNCIKHAFSKCVRPSVRINFRLEGQELRITFRDNGSGYPDAVLNDGRRNVGLHLIYQLIEQTAGGTIELSNDHGAVTLIHLVIEEKS